MSLVNTIIHIVQFSCFAYSVIFYPAVSSNHFTQKCKEKSYGGVWQAMLYHFKFKMSTEKQFTRVVNVDLH